MPAPSESTQKRIADEAVEFCRELLKFDTSNPPGNELPAAKYLQGKLEEVGYATQLFESAPGRGNLVARYPGKGGQKPLLLLGHLDVVPASEAGWDYPPFSGAEADGCLWGRGAVGSKNMSAMACALMRHLKRDNVELDRDVIFAAVADKEAGCIFGSKWLVDNHPELIEAEFALGEAGGFSLHLGNSTFYPIQVAEKGFAWIKARCVGEPAHGSLPRPDNAIVKLAQAIDKLSKTHLPAHPTALVKDFIHTIAVEQPAYVRPLLRILSAPRLMPMVVKLFPEDPISRSIRAMLANTASPNMIKGGDKINLIPGEAEVWLDGRTIPGQTVDDLLRELKAVLGPDIELQVVESGPPVITEPIASELYSTIEASLHKREDDAVVLPYMSTGFTDAKYISQLGTRWYGFCPLRLDPSSGIQFAELYHGHNERIPVAALQWGATLLAEVVQSFCQQDS